MGFSHFGIAWIAMTMTCGPHHFVHGIHIGFEGRQAGVLDLVVVLAGVPAGLAWFSLRLEAFLGGRGDRYIKGTPFWIAALPALGAAYVTGVGAAVIGMGGDYNINAEVVANIMLVGLYVGVGIYAARTQIANRRAIGGWSVSGVALSVVFMTCALMHGVYAVYMASGQYASDVHNHWVDIAAVPAALYFLWVIRALHRGTYMDWNGAPGSARAGGVARAADAGAAA
jgi:hypothetical protein